MTTVVAVVIITMINDIIMMTVVAVVIITMVK